jgi:hypothetical protein
MLNQTMALCGLSAPASQPEPKDATMKKRSSPEPDLDEMPAEVDFSGGERGRYAARFSSDTIAVVLEPDIAKAFPTAESVNATLRRVLKGRKARLTSSKRR